MVPIPRIAYQSSYQETMTQLVIVGGGHAAAQLCASLLEKKFDGKIILVTDEPHVPYHRPPLSKTLIKDAAAVLPELRNAAFYEQGAIEMRLATHVLRIDRAAKTIRLSGPDGESDLAYDHLVLATGASQREIPHAPDGTANIFYLRTYAHAVALRDALAQANRVFVLGGGFIGLEVAASARQLGKDVTVFETQPRLLARAVSPDISDHLTHVHRGNGIDLRLGAAIDDVLVEEGRFAGIKVNGELLQADLLVVGIGAIPRTALAKEAGLDVDGGIVVDHHMLTADPSISAIGDCATFPHPSSPAPMRLESVQNANDQAKTVAARMCGDAQAYVSVPWFWSDQGEARLQITGLWRPGYTSVRRAAAKGNGFSLLHFDGEQFCAIESINSPVDQMGGRKLLQGGLSPDPVTVGDVAVPLKAKG